MSQYAPQFVAATLYRRESNKGTVYFTGFMGRVRLTVLKTQEIGPNGEEVWSLLFQEATNNKPAPRAAAST